VKRSEDQGSLGDPLVRREQVSESADRSATGDRLGLTSGQWHHRRDGEEREPDERADGPEPGHLMTEERSEETEGRASARAARERDPETPGEPVYDRGWMRAPDA
jgi:hypothetical protein